MVYDPSRAMIPIDPGSIEAGGQGSGGLGVTPVPKVRGILSKLGRGIAEGEYSFEAPPATLPFKPTRGTNLLYLLQGILGGMTGARHAKESRQETADKKAFREAELAGAEENRKLRKQEIDQEGRVLDAKARQEQIESDAKIRDIALKVTEGSGGSVRFSDVYKGLKSGNEEVLNAATDAYSTMKGLGPAGGQFFASRVAQFRLTSGEPTAPDLAKMAGEAADFVHKSLKNDEAKKSVDINLAREEVAKAEALRKAGYDKASPGSLLQYGQSFLSSGTQLLQTASVEYRALAALVAKNGMGDWADALMTGNDDVADDILAKLKGNPNKNIAAAAKRVMEIQRLGMNLMRHASDVSAASAGTQPPELDEPSVPDLSAPGNAADGSAAPPPAPTNAAAPPAAAPPPVKKTTAQRVREYVAGGMTQAQAIDKVAAEAE